MLQPVSRDLFGYPGVLRTLGVPTAEGMFATGRSTNIVVPSITCVIRLKSMGRDKEKRAGNIRLSFLFDLLKVEVYSIVNPCSAA